VAPAGCGAGPEGERGSLPGGASPPGLELAREVRARLSDEVVDELLAGARGGEEVVGPGGVLRQLSERLVERALQAELSERLG
jgi:putative transposase